MSQVSTTRATFGSQRYRFAQTVDSSIRTRRPAAIPLTREGLFRTSASALARSANDVSFFGNDREQYVLKVYNKQFTISPGETVTITHPRFMSSGKNFIVRKVVEVDQGPNRYTQITVWG